MDRKRCHRAATRLALILLLAAVPRPAFAPPIVVDNTTCTLVDAVAAANTDSVVGGCTSGSGADTIALTADVTLVSADNVFLDADNGLPVVHSEITLDGAGFAVVRDALAAPFRFFAVAPDGALTLHDVTLQGGAVETQGGALASLGTVVLTNSTVTGNHAGATGGGIWSRGPLSVAYSTISDNSTGDIAGGISTNAILTVTSSTLSGNSAPSFGGAILQLDGSSTLTNSTLSGNSADTGGGIYLFLGTLELRHSTLSGNAASVGGGIAGQFAYPSLMGTIVANSSGGNCSVAGIVDGGANFDDDASCGPGVGTITGLDGMLDDNGGATSTHALLAGSSAIDAAPCALSSDQRGQPRSDDACDSGAYEFQCGVTIAWEATGTRIHFTPDTSPFDLVTGVLEHLHADRDFSRATCLGTFATSPAVDPLPKPVPGEGRYYLARGVTSCVGAGYGDSSLIPDPRDALETGPCP